MPKVSVLIATYNCSAFIAQAIESVLAGGFTSLEVVILDDGSRDGTAKILDKYRKHPLIIIINQKHRGLGWARVRLIKAARGKYIALFDADDIMLPGRIKKQAGILDRHPSFGGCYGKAKIVDISLRPTEDKMFGKEFGVSFQNSWDIIRIAMLPGTLMFRKSIAEKIGGFNKKFYYSVDTDFMFRLAENTKLFFLNENLILYRRRQGSNTHTKEIYREELKARRMAILRRYGVDLPLKTQNA